MTEKQTKKIANILDKLNIELYHEDAKDIDTLEELEEFLNDNSFFDVEVIYHSKAMKYLMGHDSSLRISLGMAHDLGYTTDKLNSELLATLLASKNKREEFNDVRDEIEAILA
jgi:hypothetical protein